MVPAFRGTEAMRWKTLRMPSTALKVELNEIQSLRALFLQETNFQIRYNACHERGWTDSYLLTEFQISKI
jgi:hypothetical protein